jgi:hypothetical protein
MQRLRRPIRGKAPLRRRGRAKPGEQVGQALGRDLDLVVIPGTAIAPDTAIA